MAGGQEEGPIPVVFAGLDLVAGIMAGLICCEICVARICRE